MCINVKKWAWRHSDVTYVPLVTRLYSRCSLKKVDFDLHTVCFSWTSGDARGLGLLFMVCACAVGLGGNVLIGMRGTWGVVWRSAHVLTIPFTWLRRAKALSPTAHASNHHATIGVFLWMRMFFIPWGHVKFHDHIWALWRQLGHMTYMLDSDWLKKFLLRSDWSIPKGAIYTTALASNLQKSKSNL